MTKDQVIEHYNLLCKIDKLEEFIKAMDSAESIKITIFGKVEFKKERYLPSDEINTIRNSLQNKLDKLNKELEEL